MGNAIDFDRAVQLVYPYLSNTTVVHQQNIESLSEFVTAGRWLLANLHRSRGPSFETLRSLSAAENKATRSDPRDSLGVKLIGKFLMGDGTSDSDVESFVKVHLETHLKQAVLQIVQQAGLSGSSFLADESNRQMTLDLIATELLGGTPLRSHSEEEFDERIQVFKVQIRQSLTSPGLLGNLLASQGRSVKEWQKADKRASKGRYSQEDLAALTSYARRYRPTVETIARIQKSLGWEILAWDPVSEVDRLRRR